MMLPNSLTIHGLRQLYLDGKLTPQQVITQIRERIASDANNPIWISVLSDGQLAHYLENINHHSIDSLPLWGIPFAIKDNIDLAGIATTAACPLYTYTPTQHASVVQKLIDAGAIPLGKTNLDQFATGLVGVRSPYGEVHNAFLADYISGGSSSGSAVALARGHVAFALGTDTAGSGRVPASLNNLVGVKPSRGLLSTRGVVPACRTLDCVSLFTRDIQDAKQLLEITAGFDVQDAFSRHFNMATQPAFSNKPTLGIPRSHQWEFYGNSEAAALFDNNLAILAKQGALLVEIDFEAFRETADMLYGGPWVAERWLTAHELLKEHSTALLPVIEKILQGATIQTAADAFATFYRLQALRRAVEPILQSVDAIVTPTIPCPYTRAQIAANPITLNSHLGYYTNFMNLLDLAAIAIPANFFTNGLPNGITLFADSGSDKLLLDIADIFFSGLTSTPTEDSSLAKF